MSLAVTDRHAGSDSEWPGWSDHGRELISQLLDRADGRALRREFADRFSVSYDRPLEFAAPLVLRAETWAALSHVVASVHRAVERLLERWSGGEPPEVHLAPQFAATYGDRLLPGQSIRIDLCRMDFSPTADGGFQLLEINANCPGGVTNTGVVARAWREALLVDSDRLRPLKIETSTWLTGYLVDELAKRTGEVPERAAVVCERGGWQHEVRGIAQSFHDAGVESEVLHPDEVRAVDLDRGMLARGRWWRVGYQKIGMRGLLDARRSAPLYLAALETGAVQVQNGFQARFVADSKLALAELHRAALSGTAPAALLAHLPWSADAHDLDPGTLSEVLGDRQSYVLKRALGTRGDGVHIGADADGRIWSGLLEDARQQHWLVQSYVEPTRVRRWPGEGRRYAHDISVFCLGGRAVGAFSRSSDERRLNVGVGAVSHAVLLDRGAHDATESEER